MRKYLIRLTSLCSHLRDPVLVGLFLAHFHMHTYLCVNVLTCHVSLFIDPLAATIPRNDDDQCDPKCAAYHALSIVSHP